MKKNIVLISDKKPTPVFSDQSIILHLILEGRSSFTAEQQALLKSVLGRQEINAIYVESDVAERNENIVADLEKVGRPINIEMAEGWFFQDRDGSRFSYIVKRLFDVMISLIALPVVALVAVVIYPIVQAQSPGSLLFIQERVGKHGRPFKMYKFRSMYQDAENQKSELLEQNQLSTNHMFKMDNDPRIFPFGQKMRAWSIDELPQFINVLKGDMSFIGTRPPTRDEHQKYELHHFKRLAIKPGITGMWQVSGRSDITNFEQVVWLDNYYIDNWSLWLDIKIILKTIKVVLKREGSK